MDATAWPFCHSPEGVPCQSDHSRMFSLASAVFLGCTVSDPVKAHVVPSISKNFRVPHSASTVKPSSVLFTLFRSSTNAGQHRISPVTFVYAKSDRWQHPSHESQLSGLCALLRHSHVSAIPIRDHQLYYGLDSLQPRCNTELQAS